MFGPSQRQVWRNAHGTHPQRARGPNAQKITAAKNFPKPRYSLVNQYFHYAVVLKNNVLTPVAIFMSKLLSA